MDAKYQPVRYSMTYPASELHIAKARSAPTEIWMETKEMFERLHQPFISSQLQSLQWVYNILGKPIVWRELHDYAILSEISRIARFNPISSDFLENRPIYSTFIKKKVFCPKFIRFSDKNREKCNEVDRIVVEDADQKNGFLIVPDLKWDGKDTKQLNLCVLVNRRDLPTVRHLNADHLEMLENILHKSSKEISAKYKVPVS